MPPDIDMIGEQDLGALELQVGHGHVVYTGGAKGTDALVEEHAKQFGMQLEVLVPPNHPRATFITPSTVEVLMLANPASSPGSGETRQTNAQSFLHPAIAATQLSNWPRKPIPSMPLASWNRIINA